MVVGVVKKSLGGAGACKVVRRCLRALLARIVAENDHSGLISE